MNAKDIVDSLVDDQSVADDRMERTLCLLTREFKAGDVFDRLAGALIKEGLNERDVYAAAKHVPTVPEHVWMRLANRMRDTYNGQELSEFGSYARGTAKVLSKLRNKPPQ